MSINSYPSRANREQTPPRRVSRPAPTQRVPDYRRRPLPRVPGEWRPVPRPSPMNAGLNAGRLAGLAPKLIARFIPGIGWLLLAYEVWQWLQQPQNPAIVPAGSSGTHFTNTGAHVDGGFWGLIATTNAAHTHTNSSDVGYESTVAKTSSFTLHATLPTYVNYNHRCLNHLPAQRRVYLKECLTYPAANPVPRPLYYQRPIPRWIGFKAPPRPLEMPQVQPWVDPSRPPTHQPQAKPWRRKRRPTGPQPDPTREPQPKWGEPMPRRMPREIRREPPDETGWPKPLNPPRTRPWPNDWPPFPAPIIVPAPRPIVTDDPLPGVGPNPGTQPWPHPNPGPAPLPRPGIGLPFPAPQYPPQPPPGYQVKIDTKLRTSGRMRGMNPRSKPGRVRPDKEMKVGVNAVGGAWALWVFNFITETKDALEAIEKALPCNKQPKGHRTIPAILDNLYKNWHLLDPSAAMSELILNQIEDAIIGRAQRAVSALGGSAESWQNYHNTWVLDQDTAKERGKMTNAALDEFAKSMGLKRIAC